jgi:dihydroorotase
MPTDEPNPGRTLIRHGRVIDPSRELDTVADVLLDKGKVAEIGKVKAAADNVIDAKGLIVCPGLIDIHVHFREPGDEQEETIASGSAAAVAGGFTSVACMPNTQPPLDDATAIEFVTRQADRAGLCNVFPVGAVTKGREGRELAEMGQMVRAGAVAFSDDGSGVASAAVMLRALQYVAMFDKPIIQHCEDPDLAAGGVMHAGEVSVRLGLPGIPAVAEELMVQRDIRLTHEVGGRYHVAHISTRGAVNLVRRAKHDGVQVTAEATPHHLLLTDEACAGFDTNLKMNPPLRTRHDIDACIAGVVDGTIDCLVTDHAPHGTQEKELLFAGAPFGVIGLESALPLYVQALVAPGHLDWPGLIARMTINPARVLGLRKGTLREGADADVVLIDPDHAWTIDASRFFSKSRNCPFDGWKARGRVVMTLVGGEPRFHEGQLVGAAGAPR